MSVAGIFKNDKAITVDGEDHIYLRGDVQLRGRYVVVNGEYLHRAIMRPRQDEVVDHINGNPLDNRRSNLRVCSQEENSKNRKLACNNTSGVTGVSRYIRHGRKPKWQAHISINKRQVNLGSYDLFEDAVNARQEAEIKHYGQFRHNKSQHINN